MNRNGKVLIVDDEKNITFVIDAMLRREGFDTLSFTESSAALKALQETPVDAVVTDLFMPGTDGMQMLETCKEKYPDVPVVMITAYGSVGRAVDAIKRGAFDFITKPFEQTELLSVIRKAVETHKAREKEPRSMRSREISNIIGESAQIQEIFRVISKIAPSPSTVLIQGESGTGKELVAQEIHERSSRASRPFIKINCAAIPSTLIESELFGYEKGAFTGAVTSKPGRFELAHQGTLFLDEIAEMPLEMQVKLLRVLQEQEFERVGGISSIRVDVRIIAATNRKLEDEVSAGRFREDLFYRLNVVPIHLPPLRERKDDIELLVHSFVRRFNEKLGKKIEGISPEAMEILKRQSWPGNIRQLENTVERMILMAESEILQTSDLPREVSGVHEPVPGAATGGLKEIVRKQTQSLEKGLIEKALEETGGNVTRASEKLGLSRKGLQLKMKELGLSGKSQGKKLSN